MDDNKIRSLIQEDVARLYLRLNGFFVTGFISHSPTHGRILTEIDALGVRLPYSSEPEREVGPHDLLGLSGKFTELAICEVKSRRQRLCFNKAFSEDIKACTSVLRWAGLFSEGELSDVVTRLQGILQSPLSPHEPPTIEARSGSRVRCLMFSLEKQSHRNNQPWFIGGPEVFEYIFRCLCPQRQRPTCSTQYDFDQWREYSHIVRYFKDRSSDAGDLQQLYKSVEHTKYYSALSM